MSRNLVYKKWISGDLMGWNPLETKRLLIAVPLTRHNNTAKGYAMQEKKSGIYKIINTVNQMYYVGSSMNMVDLHNNRRYSHFHSLKINKHCNLHLQRAFNKYGEKNFKFVIVEDIKNITNPDLLKLEQKYLDIAKLEKDKCYNKSFIAGRIDFTLEVRAKMSLNSKLRFGNWDTNPNVGKKCKKETRIKISLANTGRHHSEETLRKMSAAKIGKFKGEKNPRFGKKLSDKTRKKISRACQGKNMAEDNYKYNPQIYTFYKKKTGKEYLGTYYFFCKNFPEVSKSSVTNLINGKYGIANGWKIKGKERSPVLSRKDFKGYKIISPQNDIYHTENLSKFCRDNNLKVSNLCDVLKGRIKKSHGWKAEYYS